MQWFFLFNVVRKAYRMQKEREGDLGHTLSAGSPVLIVRSVGLSVGNRPLSGSVTLDKPYSL